MCVLARECEFCSILFFKKNVGFSLAEREPFLLQAKDAASRLLDSRVKPKETAYQFYISENFDDAHRNNPQLSLAELTQQVLAPKWNTLTADERSPYEDKALTDAKRWKREQQREQDLHQEAAPRNVLESIKNQAEVVETGHLSGQGLFAASNFDARDGVQNQADLVRMWTQMDDQQQLPWKAKALSNQKNFALRALKTHAAKGAPKKKQKKSASSVKQAPEHANED